MSSFSSCFSEAGSAPSDMWHEYTKCALSTARSELHCAQSAQHAVLFCHCIHSMKRESKTLNKGIGCATSTEQTSQYVSPFISRTKTKSDYKKLNLIHIPEAFVSYMMKDPICKKILLTYICCWQKRGCPAGHSVTNFGPFMKNKLTTTPPWPLLRGQGRDPKPHHQVLSLSPHTCTCCLPPA